MNTAQVRTMNDQSNLELCEARGMAVCALHKNGAGNGLRVFFIEHPHAASGRLGRIAQCANQIRGAGACSTRVANGTLLSNAQTDAEVPRTVGAVSARKMLSIHERDRFC